MNTWSCTKIVDYISNITEIVKGAGKKLLFASDQFNFKSTKKFAKIVTGMSYEQEQKRNEKENVKKKPEKIQKLCSFWQTFADNQKNNTQNKRSIDQKIGHRQSEEEKSKSIYDKPKPKASQFVPFLLVKKTKKKIHSAFCFFFTSSIPWKNAENFDCIIAIDFGTDGTSMGINIKGKDTVRLVTDWNSSGICDKKEIQNKTKTALLMSRNYEIIAFGNEAWAKFCYSFQFGFNKSKFLFFFKI
ncbi:hypothetical protein RFI_28402 [Reticulomyxa filosa]|uniref:Uncharacterized protein n=1 Tax=Reticulomyxa filosa TaxID=46433 RepID=X6M505_RETFI|nr:hypothetical protein RFI_28402 [Reticulomyxa filosa]|eukprot:ETO08984.1 hypothetical protein RFI_28402 [Reticulomyxa filosa]